jgi:hypothetical protein
MAHGHSRSTAAARPSPVAATANNYALVGGYGEQRFGEGGYQRYMVPKLSATSSALFEELLRARLLPFISRELPAVEDV